MSDKGKAKWGILGVIAGAIAGVLFAPKAGKETREDIKKGAVKAKDEVGEKAGQVKTEVSKKVTSAKKGAGDLAGKATRAAKKGAGAVKEEFSKED